MLAAGSCAVADVEVDNLHGMLSAHTSRLSLLPACPGLSYKAVMDSNSRAAMSLSGVPCGVSSWMTCGDVIRVGGITEIHLIAHAKKWDALKAVRMPPIRCG